MISKEQLHACMPSITVENLNKYIDPLNQAMERFQINAYQRTTIFLAQAAHESGCLRYNKELSSGEAYDTGELAKTLGNTPEADGDGQKYKGRGIFQITGLNNYKALSAYFGQDFVNHPELLEGPVWASLSAGWFWDVKQFNSIADQSDGWRKNRKLKSGELVPYDKFQWITYRINGGLTHIEDRLRYYHLAQIALK